MLAFGKQLNNFQFQEITPPTIAVASIDNYTGIGDYSFARLSGFPVNTTITGITNGIAGKLICIVNVAAQSIVFTNEDFASIAINRILTISGVPLTLAFKRIVFFIYDGIALRWRQITIFG